MSAMHAGMMQGVIECARSSGGRAKLCLDANSEVIPCELG